MRAIEIREKTNKSMLPDLLDGLADCYRRQNKYVEAEGALRRSITIREKAKDPHLVNCFYALGSCYAEQHKNAEAELMFRRAKAFKK